MISFIPQSDNSYCEFYQVKFTAFTTFPETSDKVQTVNFHRSKGKNPRIRQFRTVWGNFPG